MRKFAIQVFTAGWVLTAFLCCPLWANTTTEPTDTGAVNAKNITTKSIDAISTDEHAVKACVIVLHGLGRTEHSMSKIERRLQEGGYAVWNEGYPSRSASIETLAQETIASALQFCSKTPQRDIHFVTHSLGGILVRTYLQENTIERLNKIVMLSPPNQGSEIVNAYRDNWLFRTFMGPAFFQLGTDGIVQTLKPIPGTIGIITGTESSDPWFSGTIPGPDDGKVSVASAKLDEMTAFLEMPEGHTFIMSDDTVISQVLFFLRQGVFQTLPSSSQ